MLVGIGEERRHLKQQEQNTAKTIFGLVLAIVAVVAIVSSFL